MQMHNEELHGLYLNSDRIKKVKWAEYVACKHFYFPSLHTTLTGFSDLLIATACFAPYWAIFRPHRLHLKAIFLKYE
jgi:hypothetical protein